MKRIIALLASLAMLASMGIAMFSANAASTHMVKSELEEYDYSYVCTVYHENENGEVVPSYEDWYLKFNSMTGGDYYAFNRKYEYIFVTVSDGADVEPLTSVLGKEVSDYIAYTIGDNQHVFRYAADADCKNLYNMAGVENVELAKLCWTGRFGRNLYIWEEDPWAESVDEYDPNLAVSIVQTEPGTVLTAEMFADTGFTVQHVYQSEPEEWYVYFTLDRMEAYTDFDIEVEKIDGVLSSGIYMIHTDSGNTSLAFITVEKAAEPSTEEPTENPTDAEVPTEPPTTGENPTEPPTEKSTEKTAVTTGGTQNPKTGMPWGGAVQGLAAALTVGGTALFIGFRRKGR